MDPDGDSAMGTWCDQRVGSRGGFGGGNKRGIDPAAPAYFHVIFREIWKNFANITL
jgi:hypothetical protein